MRVTSGATTWGTGRLVRTWPVWAWIDIEKMNARRRTKIQSGVPPCAPATALQNLAESKGCSLGRASVLEGGGGGEGGDTALAPAARKRTHGRRGKGVLGKS